MILVTCGTQKQQFNRLFDYVEKLPIDEEIVMQLGHTKHVTNYLSYEFSEQFDEDIKKADVIITHGGVGTIMQALLLQKKVIVVPRLSKYEEHVDDHQLEIANLLSQQGYIYCANNYDELENLMKNIDDLKFEIYHSNQQKFNNSLNDIIKQLKDSK